MKLQVSLFPLALILKSHSVVAQYKCFENGDELYDAVRAYEAAGGVASASNETNVTLTYGPTIGDWCVDYVEDFESIFEDSLLNEPLTNWNTSSATR